MVVAHDGCAGLVHRRGVVKAVADDHLVFVNGRLQSARTARVLERIERDVAKVEFDLLQIECWLENKREAYFKRRDAVRGSKALTLSSPTVRAMPRLKYRMNANARLR
jgi:hypothetical protein